MGVEALRRHHAIDGIVGGQHDLAFRQVEIERCAFVAGALDRAIGGVERLQNGRQQRPGGFIGPTVDRGLRLHVVEPRRRAHEHAMEAVGTLAAVGADHDAHRQRGAILAGLERAQIVGDALRQHRHDPVGEVDRIAAHERLAVERGAGPHVMGDVGDGDADHEAAGIVGIVIARGVHGVVMVLGVGRIDGDERQLAPILAAGKPRRLGGLRFRRRGGRKHVRDRMGVDGDEADRALGRERAQLFCHARAGEPIAAPARRDLDRHQVAIARVCAGARRDRKLVAELLLVDRREPPAAARRRAENAEHALPGAVDELDDAPAVADRIVLLAALLDPQQRAIADAGDFVRPRAARNAHADLRERGRARPRPTRSAARSAPRRHRAR